MKPIKFTKIGSINKYFLSLCLFVTFIISSNAQTSVTKSQSELDVEQVVKKFIKFTGNYQLDSAESMLAPNASLGIARLKNDKWNTYTYNFSAFIKILKADKPNPYTETISKFTTYVESDRLAFVRADAILYRNDIVNSHNMDYFTLIKLNGTWKFINVCFTVIPNLKK